MTKSTITRERLEELAAGQSGFNLRIATHEESQELACMALTAMNGEPVDSNYRKLFTCTGCGAEGLDEPLETNCHCCVDGAHWVESRLYRHAQPAQTGVDDDVRNIIGLLEANEWAEHCTETVLGSRLEAEITRLVGCTQPAPVVPAVSDDIGEIRVGRLPTMNQDDYPGLGDWWVQLRIGEDSDEVLARVYGATPQEANSRAEALACRAAMLQAEPVTTANKLGNSPVIPDGLIAAVNHLLDSDGSRGCYSAIQCGDAHDEIERLLAAAPQDTPALDSVQSVVTVSDTWIPVSERMPEDEQEVLTINRMGHRFVSFFDKHSGLFFDRLDAPSACCIEHVLVTHWMELPAAPQEVVNGQD